MVTETLFLADEQLGQDAGQLSTNLIYTQIWKQHHQMDRLHETLKPL